MVDYPVQRRDEFDVTVADSLRGDNPLASMVGEVRRSNRMTLGHSRLLVPARKTRFILYKWDNRNHIDRCMAYRRDGTCV